MNVTLPKYVSGDYAVGTECFTVIDSERKEVLGSGEGNRKIAVRMYYPVLRETVNSMQRADIFSVRKMQALQKTYHIKNVAQEMKKADYYENAAHVEGEMFPLVLYNHGYNAYLEANTFLCCELASNGYIVASVGHAHEALLNEYDDGTFDEYDKRINKVMYDNMLAAMIAQMSLLRAKGTKEELYQKFDAFQNKMTKVILHDPELLAKGIDVVSFTCAGLPKYDPETVAQFNKQKEADLAKRLAEAEKIKFEAEKIKVEAEYARQIAEQKGKAEAQMANEVQNAERTKKLAEIAAQQKVEVEKREKEQMLIKASKELEVTEIAKQTEEKKLEITKIKADQKIVDAQAKQKEIERSGAITEQERVRLEFGMKTKIGVAAEMAKTYAHWSPQVIQVSGGNGNVSSATSSLDNFLNMEAAKAAIEMTKKTM